MIKKIILTISLIFVLILVGCKTSTNINNDNNPNDNNNNLVKCNHENLEWVTIKDSTCIELGSKKQICSHCKQTITNATIYYKDHVEKVISGTPATCIKDGLSSSIVCSLCDKVLEAATVLPSSGHNYVISDELSTSDILVYVCTNCDDSYQIDNTSGNICENGHTASNWITTSEATCSNFGSAHKICINCNIELEIKSLEKEAHKEETIKGTPANCGVSGLSDGIKCSVCDYIIKEQSVLDPLEHDYIVINTVPPTSDEDGYIEYKCNNCNHTYQKTVSATGRYDELSPTIILLSNSEIIVTNNNGGVIVNNNEILINLPGEYDIMGELNEGSIIVSLGEEDDATINLKGVTLTSTLTHPIYIESGNAVDISAKSGTTNYIYDNRTATNLDVVGGAIYSKVDLDIKGKGTLYVSSSYNNGITSTKDLEIKNLTLEVNAPNNALKGNDSITIESGTIKAISSSGDALKTENTDVSEKGKQRGIITIIDGTLDLYAACDGIDASYDCIIEGGTINIYTEKYSTYSGDVTVNSSTIMYLRISTRTSGLNNVSKYSAMFVFENNDIEWKSGTYVSANGKKYYKFDVPASAKYVKFYAYSSSQTQNQSSSYLYASDQLSVPSSYDTYYINSASSSKLSGSWENFSSPSGGMGGPGGPGGPGGGMQEGNPNSSTYSCKGIKADNSITINGGTINIKSHDDGIHTNSDVLLASGSYGNANLTINGGNIIIYTDDDGIHSDSTLTINDGNIIISNSYEGIEGNVIHFIGGVVQIKSSDDGVNAKSTLYFSGSTVYLDANGDGLDSNGNIYMSAGIVIALGPTNGGNGVIDYGDRNCTFSFSGGLLIAVGCSGMNAKPTATTGNTATATTTTAPSVNSYLTVTSNGSVIAVVKITKSNQNYRVLAYNNTDYPSTSISVSTTNSYVLTNGLYYLAK